MREYKHKKVNKKIYFALLFKMFAVNLSCRKGVTNLSFLITLIYIIMSLIKILSEATKQDLNRALNSNKEYLHITVAVFNAGAVVNLKCTDIYKDINPNTWNGYDSFIENDNTTKFYISEILKERENN